MRVDPNQRWAMDFMQDVLRTGAKVRVFTLIDVWRRECVALRAAAKFTGKRRGRHSERRAPRARRPAERDSVRQRHGVHLDGVGSLGVLEQGAARLQPPGETRGQFPVRGLQRVAQT